jgi:hypothetical protein
MLRRPIESTTITLSWRPYGVCTQIWALAYFGHPNIAPTAPLQAMSPVSPTDAFTQEPTVFSVTARLATGASNEFHWTIDGPGYSGPTAVGTNDPTYEHTFGEPGVYTLSCEIIADTNFIKPEKFGANVDTAIWDVDVVDSSVDSDGDGYSPAGGDCDDSNIATYPGAPELCDGENNDCDDPSWPVALPTELDEDMDGYAECLGDCDDADAARSPGLPEIGCDGIDNDCDPGTSDAADLDGDTHVCDVDCDEGNPDTYPGAPEVNDAGDNQCSGDAGYGFVDEIGPTLRFLSAGDMTIVCWAAQAGATDYQVMRSDSADTLGVCTWSGTAAPCWIEAEAPLPGGVYYYLVQPLRPHQGSLGGNSGGVERTDACGSETRCEDSLDNDGDALTDCDDPDCLGAGACTSVTFQFVETAADDIATTDLQAFFEQLDAAPGDFIRVTLDANGTLIDWCSERADFYREQYLALAPTTGSADSVGWSRWSRLDAGTWLGPDMAARTNNYGGLCDSPYSWCLEPTLARTLDDTPLHSLARRTPLCLVCRCRRGLRAGDRPCRHRADPGARDDPAPGRAPRHGGSACLHVPGHRAGASAGTLGNGRPGDSP